MLSFIKFVRRRILGNLRLMILKLTGRSIEVGKNFLCQKYFYLANKHRLKAGDNVFFGRHAHVVCDLEIGNNVMMASYVSFVGGDHKFDEIGETPMMFSGREHNKPIIIKDNVWIGHGAIILSGVTIESGAVIAAGALVTQNVGANEIVGGVPAKFIRKRKMND